MAVSGEVTWEATMRGAVILLAVLSAALGFASESFAANKIRLAQSSTVTNCMMTCNSQAAACQTTCLVPGTPPTGAATTGSNANTSTACQLNCSTTQITCQTTCARTSPSP